MNTRMLEDVNTIYEVGGKTAIVGTILLTGWNWAAKHLSLEAINPWLIFATGVISLLYMLSKWRGQILKNKQAKLELKQMQRLEKKQAARDEQRDA